MDQGFFSDTIAPGGGGQPFANDEGRTPFTETVAPLGGGFSETLPPNRHDYLNVSPIPSRQPQQPVGNFEQTMPPKRVSGKGEFPRTVSVDSTTPSGQPSPVVGWLVALNGPLRGTDYRIHANYNYIGREIGDIKIHGDQAISAQRDSSIAYVVKTNRFYISHDQGLNTVLVNDEPVMGGARELKDRDMITLGSTVFMFVALCNEKFDWSDPLKGAVE